MKKIHFILSAKFPSSLVTAIAIAPFKTISRKKDHLNSFLTFIIILGFTCLLIPSFAGNKSGSTFSNKTFKDNTFGHNFNNKVVENDNKVLSGVPDPPSGDKGAY